MTIDEPEFEEGLTGEAALARRLGVSLDVLRRVRETQLKEGRHWVRGGKAIYLTGDAVELLTGQREALQKKGGGPGVVVVVGAIGPGAVKKRGMKGRVKASGEICTVFLTGRAVFASQFRPGQEIVCTPRGEMAGTYEFDGRPPKRLPV